LIDKYKKIRVGNKLIPEHLVVASQTVGRELRVSEVVHHINGDEKDNRAENLLVLPSRKAHSLLASIIGCFLEEKGLVDSFRDWYDTTQRELAEKEEELRVALEERAKLEKRAKRYKQEEITYVFNTRNML